MQGVIRGPEVVKNFPLIVREFGPRVAFRVLMALVMRRRCTFLEVVMA